MRKSRVSSIRITMLFNSVLIKCAFSLSEAQDQTAAGDAQPCKSSIAFVFNHQFFTPTEFHSKVTLVLCTERSVWKYTYV